MKTPKATLGDYVDAYESAQAREGRADLTQFLPEPDDPSYLAIVCELIRVDLEYGWQRGQPMSFEHYVQRFPEVFQDPRYRSAIAFEEYRLRQQAGENPSAAEYAQKYAVNATAWPGTLSRRANPSLVAPAPLMLVPAEPQTSGPSQTVCDDSASSSPAAAYVPLFSAQDDADMAQPLTEAVAVLPQAGEEFLGFRLIAELGRGTFGRVFLAQQDDLANRYVALKISTEMRQESQVLAQLQHTHIVPIHSIHQAGPLQAVCMPYYGATTLSDLLSELRRRGTMPNSGSELATLVQSHQAARQGDGSLSAAADAGKATSAAWKTLETLSYVQAVLWIACKLTEGLAHAHERGIVHRDLKPANVLLTDDGQPMLLDFNLSVDSRPGSRRTALMGGTLPYMAPEQLGALQGNRMSVDARSDLYGLGVVLYELLTGEPPFPRRHGPVDTLLPVLIADRLGSPPLLRRANPMVSPAVESIVRHCLEPDPKRRYQTAEELHDDLQRQLDDRPLRHAPEPSWRERTQKWIRRHPRLATGTNSALLAGLLVAGLVSLYVARGWELSRLAAESAAHQLQEDVKTVQFLLTSPDAQGPQLEEATDLCRKQLEQYEVLQDQHWQQRPVVCSLTPEAQGRLREGISALLASWAWAAARQAPGESNALDRKRRWQFALRLSTLAIDCYEPDEVPQVLSQQRARLARLAGEPGGTPEAKTPMVPVRASRADYLLLREQMDQGQLREVLAHVQEASRQQPQDASLWLILGNCYAAASQPAQAKVYYDLGLALQPDSPWGYFNRALVNLSQRAYPRAQADFERFLKLRPESAEAYVNRALARIGQEDLRGAVDDLTRALEKGIKHSRVYFLRSRARARLGDGPGARADFAEGLRQTPHDEDDWIARGVAQVPTNPQAALADFDKALALNPRSRRALQNKASVFSENLQRPADSLPFFDALVDLYPEQVAYRSGRGVVRARLGRDEAALQDAKEALARASSPDILYQVAGIYALTSRQRPQDHIEALRLLSTALRQGYGWDLLTKDPDLQPLHGGPEYRRLAEAARALLPGSSRAGRAPE